MVQLSVAIDDPLSRGEVRLAALAYRVSQGIGHVAGERRKGRSGMWKDKDKQI